MSKSLNDALKFAEQKKTISNIGRIINTRLRNAPIAHNLRNAPIAHNLRNAPIVPNLRNVPNYLEHRVNNRIIRYDIPHYQQPLQSVRRQLPRPPQYQQYIQYYPQQYYDQPRYQQQHPHLQQPQQPQQPQQYRYQPPLKKKLEDVDLYCKSYGYKKIVPEAPKLFRRVSNKNKMTRTKQQQPSVLKTKPYHDQTTNRTQMFYKPSSKSAKKSPSRSPRKSSSPKKSSFPKLYI